MSYLDGRRSQFPYSEKVDEILELFDVPLSKKADVREYQLLKLKPVLNDVEKVRMNELTVSLQHYIMDVETWNFFGDVIVRMQTHYLDETVGFIADLQTETEEFVETKRKEFQHEVDKVTYRGEWQPTDFYYAKNIVTMSGEGYIAQRDSANQPPPDKHYWGKITSKGDKGDPSLNINYKGEYAPAQTYNRGDGIVYGGLWYYANKPTTGNPPTDPEFWELHDNQTHTGDTEPFDPRINLWIDTSHAALLKFYDPEIGVRRPVSAGAIMSEDGLNVHTGEDITKLISDLGQREALETVSQGSLVDAINELNSRGLLADTSLDSLSEEFILTVERLAEAIDNKAEQAYVEQIANELEQKAGKIGGKSIDLTGLSNKSILIYDENTDSWKAIDYKDTYDVPSVVTSVRATGGDGNISVDYVTPVDGEYVGTRLVYKTGSYPQGIGDGTVVGNYVSGTQIGGLKNGTEYFFRLFPYNINNVANTAAGQTAKATPSREESAVRVVYTSDSLDIVWGGEM